MASEIRLPDGRIVYDPRGTVTAEPQALAPRIKSLAAIRLGVLDNTKWNASKLLRATVARLGDTVKFAEVRHYAEGELLADREPGAAGPDCTGDGRGNHRDR